jgi:hypothetical protein
MGPQAVVADQQITLPPATLSITSVLRHILLVDACLEEEDLKGVKEHVEAILLIFKSHELKMSGSREAWVKRQWKLRKAAVVASISS